MSIAHEQYRKLSTLLELLQRDLYPNGYPAYLTEQEFTASPGSCSALVPARHACYPPSVKEDPGGTGVRPTSLTLFPTGPVGNSSGSPKEYSLRVTPLLGARVIEERASRSVA